MNKEEVEKRYLGLNRMFSLGTGVWPYQKNRMRNLLSLVMYGIAMSSVYSQILRVIVFFSVDIILEQCPFLIAVSGIFVKHINYNLNHEKLKDLFNDIYDDWEAKRAPAEIEIMDIYGKRGVLFTFVYIGKPSYFPFPGTSRECY
ncbi:uncharacterized protein LOC143378846 [Andrena cerasifolii]|uniref:uncharacterized protein LOC143378846 n=1 Tax=Andrena cerasifolii TaxID=2819439 RepID=UPI004037AA15